MRLSDTSIGPLTPIMIDLLKECVYKEANNYRPLGAYYTKSAKGLFQRGLLCIKEYEVNGKKYVGFVTTPLGREYLQFIHHLEATTSK